METTNNTFNLVSRLNGGTITRRPATSNLLANTWFWQSIIVESSGTNALLYHGLTRSSMICIATNGFPGEMPHNLGVPIVIGIAKYTGVTDPITNFVDSIEMWYNSTTEGL